MKKATRVRIETKYGKFIGYNWCESKKDAIRYTKAMNVNLKATIETKA